MKVLWRKIRWWWTLVRWAKKADTILFLNPKSKLVDVSWAHGKGFYGNGTMSKSAALGKVFIQ